ncbi:MAG: bifunctional 2',3'-cyclic-nucleotide 2'-phosphodiesterase/3'-nucleotidase [Paracoccaceae bacterium]
MNALHPFSLRAAPNRAHLRIMGTTDLHMHVHGYDYYADAPRTAPGLARAAAHIAALRAGAQNSILVDNGDFLQGNPMGDYIAFERGLKAGDRHPIIGAMNALGYDAATLGNHDFNYGLDFLMKTLAGAEFPFVSANVAKTIGTAPRRDTTLLAPYKILTRRIVDGAGDSHRIRIGLIGFAPPQIVDWDREHLHGRLVMRDIVASARAWVPEMKEAGADIIIALSHSGIGAARHRDGMENASVPLAAVDGIDALMTGHSHLVFPHSRHPASAPVNGAAGTIHGKPAVMGGFWGSHLGVIDLLLEKDAGAWRVLGGASTTRATGARSGGCDAKPAAKSVQAVLNSVGGAHLATLAYVRRSVGRTAVPLHSYFAQVAGDASLRIVSMAQKHYLRRMLRGGAFAGLPMLSAAAPFRAGGRGGPAFYTDVAACDLAIRNVADLYYYPNTVRAVKVSGAQLRDWLERAAGMFRQIVPGVGDQMLLDPGFASHNFDVIDGVRYRIDLSQPSKYDTLGGVLNPGARRIVGLRYAHRPVGDDMQFIIATNSFRAAGGGDFPGAGGDTVIFEAPDTNRDVIMRYIAGQGTVNPAPHAIWSFAPLDEASVLFDTGPGAKKYLGDVKGVKIEEAGDGADGFLRYRIRL